MSHRYFAAPSRAALAAALLLGLLFSGQISAYAATSRHTMPVRTTHVVFVGASITYGFFASDPAHTYTAQLASLISGSSGRVQTSIEAYPGAKAADAVYWRESGSDELMVVQLGTNDFRSSERLSTFDWALNSVFNRLRGESPHGDLVCLSVWAYPTDWNAIHLQAWQYNQAIQRYCWSHGGIYVDLHSIFANPIDRGPAGRQTYYGITDNYHPNNQGHLDIARHIQGALHSAPFAHVS